MTDYLAKNLAFLLKGDKATQTAISEKAGVGQPTISKWSRMYGSGSASEPEFRSMARLCSVLGVSLDDLASRDIEQAGPSPESHSVGFDDETISQALDLVYLLADARPEDASLRRPSWATIKVAAKAIQEAEKDQREAIRLFLSGLYETV